MGDLVVWKPEFFGVKPDTVIKGGFIASAAAGDANGAIADVQTVRYKPMWAAYGKAPKTVSFTFMSKAAIERGVPTKLGLEKQVYGISNTRHITKKDMIHNDALPDITVNPDTFQVYVDGEPLEHPPAVTVPMTQRYFLF